MSKLASVGDYERELGYLDKLIARLRDEFKESNDFSTEMEISTLEQRRAELAQELVGLGDAKMAGHEIDLIFNGKPVHQNRLAAEFMGTVLLRVQDLVRSIRASGETANAATRGPFTDEVLRSAELHFAGSFEGSFGMRLESLDEQFELSGASPLAPTIRTMMDLLEAGDDPEAVLTHVGNLGPRSAKHYEELVEELSNSEADMRVVWPNLTGPREVSLKASEAGRLLLTLREVRESSSGQYYTGTLDIGNSRHGRFGFILDNGTAFDGIVEDHLVAKLPQFYGTRCRAWIETREVRHPRTDLVKYSHRLQDLKPLKAGSGE